MEVHKPEPLLEHVAIATIDCNGNTNFVSLDGTDKLILTGPNNNTDQLWYIIPSDTENSVQIVSSKKNLALYHHPSSGNKVKGVPLHYYKGKHTKWIMNGGNIYQDNKEGELRYLWSMDGKLYVSPDPVVSAEWQIYEPDIVENYCSTGGCGSAWVWVFLILIALILMYLMFKKN